MTTKDLKDKVITRDWTTVFEALQEFSIKHDISFTEINFHGFWSGGRYAMTQYGNIKLENELS